MMKNKLSKSKLCKNIKQSDIFNCNFLILFYFMLFYINKDYDKTI